MHQFPSLPFNICFVSFFRTLVLYYNGAIQVDVFTIWSTYGRCVCVPSLFYSHPTNHCWHWLTALFWFFNSTFVATLVMDPKIKRAKGFGFVSYRSEIEAEKAMKSLNGTVILSLSYIYLVMCVIFKPGMCLLKCLNELEP